MKYRAVRCRSCNKIEKMSLNVPERCKCGGLNEYGWQIEEKGYTCFRIEKTVKELFNF